MRSSRSVEAMKLAVVAFVLLGACSKSEGADPGPGSAAPGASRPDQAPPPDPEPPSLAEQIEAKSSAADAFRFARPHMTDTYDATSKGAFLFAQWAAAHLRWGDVHVERDETSPARVRKDADAERGKRMCYSGRIVQIARTDLVAGRRVFMGLLLARRMQIFHFLAAGSTGDLVENSRARFCGFVTGTYDYSNSGGGSSHAVELVGMFKLPENVGR